jgi:predicted O-methyltransferase YrrM
MELNERVSLKLGNDWQKNVEGNSAHFLEKVRVLQDLADDHRVNNICEIGFNAGYSALNFLIANPTASIVSFDLLEHHYAAVAASAILELFPNRNFTLIAGDSKMTVRRLKEIHSNYKCNLIFIGEDDVRMLNKLSKQFALL